MKHSYKVLPDSIAGYVVRILVIEGFNIANPFTLPLFANGCPTLLFQTQKAWLNKQPAGHVTLFGQTIQPGALTLQEDFILIAYFFKPHALIALFDIAGHELSDRHVDMNLLPHAGHKALQEKLLHCPSAAAVVALLDQHVLDRINKVKRDVSKLASATALIQNPSSSNGLKLVQNTLFVTEKTLQRLFLNNIGLSPRLYKRISQFDAAFRQLNLRTFSRLSDLAYQNGYADQSHFIRAFKEFTHLTPKEYLDFGSTQA